MIFLNYYNNHLDEFLQLESENMSGNHGTLTTQIQLSCLRAYVCHDKIKEKHKRSIMRIFYTLIFTLTFSSSMFAENKSINAYKMELTEQGYDTTTSNKAMSFNVVCIDGYRYLFRRNGTIQMKENYKGKYRHMECPIKP